MIRLCKPVKIRAVVKLLVRTRPKARRLARALTSGKAAW